METGSRTAATGGFTLKLEPEGSRQPDFPALERFRDSKLVKDAFSGLRPATAGLIAGAAYSIYELSLLNLDAFAREGIGALFRWGPIALFVILTVLIKKLPRLHPILFIVAGAVVGIVFQL